MIQKFKTTTPERSGFKYVNMNKKDFFKKNDAQFLPLGFKQIDSDPEFYYKYDLIPESERIEQGIDEDDAPRLLVGKTIFNSGICLAIDGHFIWLNLLPADAIEWSTKIISFENN